MVRLRSTEGEEFMMDEILYLQSHMVSEWVSETGDRGGCIHMDNINSATMQKVLNICHRHLALGSYTTTSPSESINAYYAEICKLDGDSLHDVYMAAKLLEIPSLIHFTSKRIAELIANVMTIPSLMHLTIQRIAREEKEARWLAEEEEEAKKGLRLLPLLLPAWKAKPISTEKDNLKSWTSRLIAPLLVASLMCYSLYKMRKQQGNPS